MTQATYPLPQSIGTKPFTQMAAAYDLRVVELSETSITVAGREDDLAAFADRLVGCFQETNYILGKPGSRNAAAGCGFADF